MSPQAGWILQEEIVPRLRGVGGGADMMLGRRFENVG